MPTHELRNFSKPRMKTNPFSPSPACRKFATYKHRFCKSCEPASPLPMSSTGTLIDLTEDDTTPDTPKRQVKASTTYWSCSACTFNNTSSTSNCSICDTPKPLSWTCAFCTFCNVTPPPICYMCKQTQPGRASSNAPLDEIYCSGCGELGEMEPESLEPVVFHMPFGRVAKFSQTSKWDCGYRNIQGLAWFAVRDMQSRNPVGLVVKAEAKSQGHVPSIRAIQKR